MESSLYDCLSINNQVTVVDQQFSLLDVFKVFIENHIDEVLFWNPDVANYDGVFTHTDLIKVALKCYSNVLLGIPNGTSFRLVLDSLGKQQELSGSDHGGGRRRACLTGRTRRERKAHHRPIQPPPPRLQIHHRQALVQLLRRGAAPKQPGPRHDE